MELSAMKAMHEHPGAGKATTGAPKSHPGIEIPLFNGRHTGVFHGFDGLDDVKEHIAIRLGNPRNTHAPLVRLHSECLTGDVFGSMMCDCGAQLNEALEKIQEHGGYLLYLRQEGRGIGLYRKLEAYRLQVAGMDTYEANRALGFDDDMRDYKVAAQMLVALGHRRIRLLSNNSEKVRQLRENGIEVISRVGTDIHCNVHNRKYLLSKAAVGGHHIDTEKIQE
jgi:GTP cyclohydrolase II